MTGPLDWDLATVAAATGGEARGDPGTRVSGVTTDSRTAGPGELFVALRGEHFDGHDFIGDALAAGAAAVLAEDPSGFEPAVLVADSLGALLDLAAVRRSELQASVIAVTGSTGKTSTKDLLAAILPGAWSSPRSFNNEVGVPLTVLSAPADARYLVVEVGSRGSGHIASLMPAVRPDVAVITNVGTVHLETFGSTDAIVAGKWELVAGLGDRGVAVLPAGDPRLTSRSHPGGRLTFGSEPDADVRITSGTVDATGVVDVELATPDGPIGARMRMVGAHQAANAAAAAAAALALGIDTVQIAAGLAAARGSAWRMEVHRGAYTVVNDAYNSNPDSLGSALRTVAAMPGRHLAVLGIMAELGDIAPAEHARLGRLAAELGFDPIVVVGDEPGLASGAGDTARAVAGPTEAPALVRSLLRDGDVVLVKGSRVAGLEELALDLAAGLELVS